MISDLQMNIIGAILIGFVLVIASVLGGDFISFRIPPTSLHEGGMAFAVITIVSLIALFLASKIAERI